MFDDFCLPDDVLAGLLEQIPCQPPEPQEPADALQRQPCNGSAALLAVNGADSMNGPANPSGDVTSLQGEVFVLRENLRVLEEQKAPFRHLRALPLHWLASAANCQSRHPPSGRAVAGCSRTAPQAHEGGASGTAC